MYPRNAKNLLVQQIVRKVNLLEDVAKNLVVYVKVVNYGLINRDKYAIQPTYLVKSQQTLYYFLY